MIQTMERTNEMPNASCLIVTLLYILKWDEMEIIFDLALIKLIRCNFPYMMMQVV